MEKEGRHTISPSHFIKWPLLNTSEIKVISQSFSQTQASSVHKVPPRSQLCVKKTTQIQGQRCLTLGFKGVLLIVLNTSTHYPIQVMW